MSHSLFLVVGYATACALWWVVSRVVPLWRNPPRPTFAKPWREVLFVLLGVVGTLLLGQLWSRGIRLNTENPTALTVGFSYAGNKNNGIRVGIAGEF